MNMLHFATQGVKASQTLLDNEALNISQMGNGQYARRSVKLGTRADNSVEVKGTERVSSLLKLQRLWTSNADKAACDVQKDHFETLEVALGGTQIGKDLGTNQFFNALDNQSGVIADDVFRANVLSASETVVQNVNGVLGELDRMDDALRKTRTSHVREINRLTASLAELNRRMGLASASDGGALALADQRDGVMHELSQHLDVRVTQQRQGIYHVSLPNGQPLVVGNRAASLQVNTGPNRAVSYELQSGSVRMPFDGRDIGGALAGIDTFARDTLAMKRSQVNAIAKVFVDGINQAQQAGIDAAGATGQAMFQQDPSHGRLTLLLRDPQKLAFATSAGGVANDNLGTMRAVKDADVDLGTLGMTKLHHAHGVVVADVGHQSRQARSQFDTADQHWRQATLDYGKAAGVDETDSASSLMLYMKLYRANAKAVSVANDVFDTILAMR